MIRFQELDLKQEMVVSQRNILSACLLTAWFTEACLWGTTPSLTLCRSCFFRLISEEMGALFVHVYRYAYPQLYDFILSPHFHLWQPVQLLALLQILCCLVAGSVLPEQLLLHRFWDQGWTKYGFGIDAVTTHAGWMHIGCISGHKRKPDLFIIGYNWTTLCSLECRQKQQKTKQFLRMLKCEQSFIWKKY